MQCPSSALLQVPSLCVVGTAGTRAAGRAHQHHPTAGCHKEIHQEHGLQPGTVSRSLVMVPLLRRVHDKESYPSALSRGWNPWKSAVHSLHQSQMLHQELRVPMIKKFQTLRQERISKEIFPEILVSQFGAFKDSPIIALLGVSLEALKPQAMGRGGILGRTSVSCCYLLEDSLREGGREGRAQNQRAHSL